MLTTYKSCREAVTTPKVGGCWVLTGSCGTPGKTLTTTPCAKSAWWSDQATSEPICHPDPVVVTTSGVRFIDRAHQEGSDCELNKPTGKPGPSIYSYLLHILKTRLCNVLLGTCTFFFLFQEATSALVTLYIKLHNILEESPGSKWGTNEELTLLNEHLQNV